MPDRSPPASPDHAAALAKQIRTFAGALKRKLREHGHSADLTPSQTAVILRLEAEGAATTAALARLEGIRHQSMSAVVGPLQEAGLIQGTPDPHDGRRTLLSLTPKCLKTLQKGRAARQDWLTAKISQSLSPREQERLYAALELLSRLIQD